jgi:hypothetical protein
LQFSPCGKGILGKLSISLHPAFPGCNGISFVTDSTTLTCDGSIQDLATIRDKIDEAYLLIIRDDAEKGGEVGRFKGIATRLYCVDPYNFVG